MILNDTNIRQYLKNRLEKSGTLAVKEELRIIHNRAIADIVTLGQILHCYEIKGEADSLSQIANQIFHYNLAFDKISVVLTKRNERTVRSEIPDFWGIILAVPQSDRISFVYIRPAKMNPEKTNRNILLSLWKSELARILKINDEKTIQQTSKKDLVDMICNFYKDRKSLNLEFSKQIIQRNSHRTAV